MPDPGPGGHGWTTIAVGFGLMLSAAPAMSGLLPFRLSSLRIRRGGCPIERNVNAALRHPERLRQDAHYEYAAAGIDGGVHDLRCLACLEALGLDREQRDWVRSLNLSNATITSLQRQVLSAARTGQRTTAKGLLGKKLLSLLRERSA